MAKNVIPFPVTLERRCALPTADGRGVMCFEFSATKVHFNCPEHVRRRDGVDAVFDGIGGDNLWRSRDGLREGGRVVIYGFQSKMRGGRMVSRSEGRHPI